jgi:hypothetical protein
MAAILRVLRAIERRVVPALLSAAGVTLLAAGLLAYAPSPAAPGSPEPSAEATVSASGQTASPSLPPSQSPASFAPTSSPGPDWSFQPPIPSSSPTAPPTPTPSPTPAPVGIASRVVVPALKIDLPVIEGKDLFPPCDVALFLPKYVQPAEDGTVYLYSHARAGMFLPLLAASQVDNGKAMLGYTALVYTTDAKVYWYTISLVKRHVTRTDWTLADNVAPGQRQLILQTSETPYKDGTKLQVRADFVLVQDADPAEANPTPKPRACS